MQREREELATLAFIVAEDGQVRDCRLGAVNQTLDLAAVVRRRDGVDFQNGAHRVRGDVDH